MELGISLLILGLGVTAIGYLILNSVPLFILGISIVIMGILAAWGEESTDKIINELMKVSWDNVAALIESVGIINKAIYIPSTMVQGSSAYALITPTQPRELVKVPTGLVIKYGPMPHEVGILIRTMGTKAVELCSQAGAISNELESSLNNCIVNHLGLARRVISYIDGDRVSVVVNDPRLSDVYRDTVVRSVLGSPMASIVASVVAESLGRPVLYDTESMRGNELRIDMVVLNA